MFLPRPQGSRARWRARVRRSARRRRDEVGPDRGGGLLRRVRLVRPVGRSRPGSPASTRAGLRRRRTPEADPRRGHPLVGDRPLRLGGRGVLTARATPRIDVMRGGPYDACPERTIMGVMIDPRKADAAYKP